MARNLGPHVECGTRLLHLLDVARAENESIRAQCETLSRINTNLDLSLADRRAEASHQSKKTAVMSDQLKSYEAKISILQSQLDACRSMPRSSTPSGGKRDEQTSLSSMEETVSLTEHLAVKEELRQLRRQHKRAGATVRELETQVEHLAAELSQRRSAAPSLQSSPQTGASRILHSAEDVEDARRAQQDLLQFVRELSAANARLASELRDSQMQCQKAQVQVANLTTLVEQLENNEIESTADLYALDISPSKEHEFVPNSLAHELWNVTTKQTPQMKRISVSIVESLSDRDDLTDTSSVSS
ncbi:hypothetical protein HDU82_002481, partial [Entophlyctis luteolus]